MKHAIFDTETTNLIHNSLQPIAKQPKIIEFFALVLDDERDWAEVETLHSYIAPGVPISAEVTKITGITSETLKGAPIWFNFWPQVDALLRRVDAVVAHNLSYDMAMIEFEAQRLGLPVIWPKKRICTVEGTEHLKGFRLSLMALYQELFGTGFEKAHSAENDVRATARCYVELVKRGEL